MESIIDRVGGGLSAPRAVLFDWDNTLVENWRSIQGAINAALMAFALPQLDLEAVKFQARHSARTIFPTLFGPEWPRARAIFEAHFTANQLTGLTVMPGAEALLDLLGRQGVPLCVVSNKKADFLRREIDYLGWMGRFRAVVGASEAAKDKPDAAPVLLALDRAGLSPGADIWLVGDTDIDMKAAIAAGCAPILVGPGPEDAALLENAAPALRCHNCAALAGLLLDRREPISGS
jgi:phosphoglycolate phosphatase